MVTLFNKRPIISTSMTIYSPDKELNSAKDRQEIEIEAQRATLAEQRNHIGILDTALQNAQLNIRRLEEEVIYIKYFGKAQSKLLLFSYACFSCERSRCMSNASSKSSSMRPCKKAVATCKGSSGWTIRTTTSARTRIEVAVARIVAERRSGFRTKAAR